MTRRTKIWVIAGSVLLGYLLLGVIAGLALRVHGRSFVQLIAVLGVLGLATAIIVAWLLHVRWAGTLGATSDGTLAGEVDALLAAARTQLANAPGVRERFGRRTRLADLNVVLLIGPSGSAKTTTVVRSGIEPELLAGDVFRGETVAPTRSANVWFARDTVFVEAAPALVADPIAWKRLLRHIRPRSFRAAITGRPQAARMAVVAYSCEEFYKPGNGEAVPAAARVLREQVVQAAVTLGVRLPVYVVFTKFDSITHFEPYVRTFSADEAREPFGAAVAPDTGAAGTYADRVTPELQQSAEELFRSLATRRLDVLVREQALDVRPDAYEFPREFRKIAPLAIEFLREVTRPSELRANPLLRGFYFVGVQPVYVTEVAPEYSPVAPAREVVHAARSATGVFGAAALAQMAQAAAPAAPRTRKVPRWDFLPRLLPEVVLGDQAAIRLTRGGARVGAWRRGLLASATVLALALVALFSISYSDNRQLERDVSVAAAGLASLPANQLDLPSVDQLHRLDAVRAKLDTLSTWDHDGAPLHLRWGLYSGSRLYPEVRRLYFAGFHKLALGAAQAAAVASLRGLPDAPGASDDYGATYALLKAYLITTTHPEKSDSDLVTPPLMRVWLAGRQLDAERAPLVARQFATYTRELKSGDPFATQADGQAVQRARGFLRQFAGSERIYQFMLAEAARAQTPAIFSRKYPAAAAYVSDPYQVPAAFTRGGWTFMAAAFRNVDRFFGGEDWVVGDPVGAPLDKAKIVAELKTRYATDYATHWRNFLRAASVNRYGSVKDAAQRLAVLSGNQSPLLALFSMVSQNTAVAPDIAAIFQPAQVITPPDVTDKLIGDKNAPYMSALVALQSSLDQAANAQGAAGESAAGQAASNAAAAHLAARQLAAEFKIDPQGQVHTVVQRLMEDPISFVEPMLRNFGAAEINARGRTFCAAVKPLLAKFPFAADAPTQATAAEVATLLRPGTGTLWTFYNDVLVGVLPKQGSQFVPQGGSVRIAMPFVTFLNRAATLSDVLFKEDPNEPRVSYSVQPQLSEFTNSVSITVDGQTVRSTKNALENARLVWNGSGAGESKLAAEIGGSEVTLVGPYTGPFAMFRLFNDADAWQALAGGSTYRVEWSLRTRGQQAALAGGSAAKIMVDVNLGAAAAVLRRGYFSGIDCPSDIAR